MLSDASTLPPDEGQAAESTSTDARTTASQLLADAASASTSSATEGTDKPASRNLHDDPNFRKLQSQYEKRLAEQEKRLRELEAEREAAALADMDDVDRLKYERDKLARQLEEQQAAREAETMKAQVLRELNEQSGVPLDVLSEADNFYDAAKIAIDYLKRNGAERREANRVDLGGGRANTPADRIETMAREAFSTGDATAYIRALREAQGG